MINRHITGITGITGAWHLFPLFLIFALTPSLIACGGGCKSALRAWEKGTAERGGGGPHWRLEVPRGELDEQLSGARERSKAAPWSPRSPLKGLPMPDLSFRLKRLDLEVSARDAAQLKLTVGLYAERQELLTLSLVGPSPLELDAKKHTMRLTVRADQFKKADLKLGEGSTRALKAAIAGWLPGPMRALVPASEIKRAAKELLKQVGDEGYGALREHILTPLGTLVRLEWGLPKVPIARVDVALTPALWRLDLYSTLKARGLPAPTPMPSGTNARLSVSGGWVAAAANWAMERGDLPSRFSAKGAPSPRGPAIARLTWGGSGKGAQGADRPLKVHFLADAADIKLCLYARVGVDPDLSVEGGALKVKVEGGVEKVVGNPVAELAAEMSGLTERSLKWHASASLPRAIKTPAGSIGWSWLGARVAGGALEVSLGLRPSRGPGS